MSSGDPINLSNIKLHETSSKNFLPQFIQIRDPNSDFDYMKYIKQISQSFENGKFTIPHPDSQHFYTSMHDY